MTADLEQGAAQVANEPLVLLMADGEVPERRTAAPGVAVIEPSVVEPSLPPAARARRVQSLTIVVPARNEAQNLSALLDEVRAELERRSRPLPGLRVHLERLLRKNDI